MSRARRGTGEHDGDSVPLPASQPGYREGTALLPTMGRTSGRTAAESWSAATSLFCLQYRIGLFCKPDQGKACRRCPAPE